MLDVSILQSLEKWKNSCFKPVTFKAEEVPLLFREPGVLSGYRLPNQPWRYYFLSVFQIHNETVNIWTHFVAFILVLFKTWTCFHDYSTDHPYFAVLFCFSICCLFYTFFSTIAHTIHSKSPYIHYTCYQTDYAGIGFYSLGSSCILYYASCYPDFYEPLGRIFLPLNVVLSWIGFVCCCTAKLLYRRPYPFKRKLWQLCSFGTQFFISSLLIVFRYIDCWRDPDCSMTSLNHHTVVFTMIVTSVFFFSSHFPEKIRPGGFDIIGQGHQIFHVLITYATLEQFRAVKIDFENHSHGLRPHQANLLHILTAICVYAVMTLVTVIVLRSFTLKRIRSDFEIEHLQSQKTN